MNSSCKCAKIKILFFSFRSNGNVTSLPHANAHQRSHDGPAHVSYVSANGSREWIPALTPPTRSYATSWLSVFKFQLSSTSTTTTTAAATSSTLGWFVHTERLPERSSKSELTKNAKQQCRGLLLQSILKTIPVGNVWTHKHRKTQ